jgi:hypothetical protein
MAILDETHRTDWVAGYEQKLALLRDDARVRWGENANVEGHQLMDGGGDGIHVPVKAAGYGGV